MIRHRPTFGTSKLLCMKYLITVAALLCFFGLQAQFIGQKLIGGSQVDHFTDVQETSAGDFIAVGNTGSIGAGNADFWIVRLDPNLDTIWTFVIGGAQNDGALSVVETVTGDFVVAGYTESFGSGGRDAYIVKLSSTGSLLWTKVFGYSQSDLVYDIIETSDGNYVMTGGIRRTNENLMLAKMSPAGNLLWMQEYDRSSNSQSGHNVRELPNGDLAVTGWSWSPVLGSADIHLMRTTNNGVIRWTRALGGSNRELGMGMEVVPNGDILVTGHSLSYGSGANDILLYRIDSVGTTVWSKVYGLSQDEFISDMDFDGSNILLHGATASAGSTDQIYLMKLDLNGDTVWVNQYGTTGINYRGSAIFTSAGNILIVGSTDGGGATMRDGYLIQTNANGSVGCNHSGLTVNYSAQGTQSSPAYTQTAFTRAPTSSGVVNHGGAMATICPVCTETFTAFPSDTTICFGDSIQVFPAISDTTGMGFSWISAGYINDTNAYHPFVSVTDSGLFQFRASKPGCTLDSSFWLHVYPRVIDTSIVQICMGDSALIGSSYERVQGYYTDTMLNASFHGCDSVHVYDLQVLPPAQGYDSATICQGDSVMFGSRYLKTAGNYIDTLYGGSFIGCDSIVQLNVQVSLPSTGNVPLTLCPGDSVLINGKYVKTQGAYTDTIPGASPSGCDSILTYQVTLTTVSTGQVALTYCPGDSVLFGSVYLSSPGTYYDTLANAGSNGCDSIVVATVTANSLPTSTVNKSVCVSDSFLVGSTYVHQTGTYYDTLQSAGANGCDSIVIYTLDFYTASALEVTGDSLVCEGEGATLTASGGVNYVWNDGEKVGQQVTFTPTETTEYTVQDTTMCGDPMGSFTVEVLKDPVLFVPDAFSPNGDGNNDVLDVQGKGIDSIHLMIYSRWGQRVFETESMDNKWDGTINGNALDNGVFVYVVKAVTTCKSEIEEQGKIVLIK